MLVISGDRQSYKLSQKENKVKNKSETTFKSSPNDVIIIPNCSICKCLKKNTRWLHNYVLSDSLTGLQIEYSPSWLGFPCSSI